MQPIVRVRELRDAPVRKKARYVLYWMTAYRRLQYNHALDRAAAWGNELKLPVLVFEPLRLEYPYACSRFHAFAMEGMRDNLARAKQEGIAYFPFVEREPDAGKGLLRELAKHAAVVLTDDYPTFFLPAMTRAAAERLDVKCESVDARGILPMRLTEKCFSTARAFRYHQQRTIQAYLEPREWPKRAPSCSSKVEARDLIGARLYARGAFDLLHDVRASVEKLPLSNDVTVVDRVGGEVAARVQLHEFVEDRLARYHDEHSDPDACVSSELSPYLHFGHISAHEVFERVMEYDGWDLSRLSRKATGLREGFWGSSPSVESFLEELLVWRELSANMCVARPADHAMYGSLPEWARASLDKHRKDKRPVLYDETTLRNAKTHDEIWNAAQRQLTRDGTIQNYLRMLWGKKILEWTKSPEDALRIMIDFNDRYALDGRDPNSYSGIFWTLGRYDRPWAPERPIFGAIRYMSSDATRKKLKLKKYLAKFATSEASV